MIAKAMVGRLGVLAATALLAACQSGEGANVPGDTEDQHAYDGISETDVVRFTGTEPFWGGQVEGDSLFYSTPEDLDGQTIAVTRFAGRGGVSFSGTLGGQALDLMVTPGDCSDGMSDRTYPFVATLQLGTDQRSGCAWREGEDDLGPPP